MHEHPPIDILARFAQGLLPPREMAAAAIHIAGCETCRTAATRPSIHPEPGPSTYSEAIRRVAHRAGHRAARHERDKRRAPGALDQILALPTEDWNRAIRSSPRYHSYAFARYALRTCRATWSDNPHRSERLAELALEVANRLPNKEHGRRNLHDLRSKAWGYIANCRRIQTNYLAIPNALEAAAEHLHLGTRDERRRIELLRFTSSYLTNTGHIDAAIDLCNETIGISIQLRDPRLRAQSFWLLGKAHFDNKHPHEALPAYEEAREALRGIHDPRSSFLLRVNFLSTEALAGRARNSLAMLRSLRPEHWTLPRLDRLRMTWLEALLSRRQGDVEIAAALLEDSWQGFRASEIPHAAALVSLDLARVRLELGQAEHVPPLTAEALHSFALLGLERESREALELFRQADGLP